MPLRPCFRVSLIIVPSCNLLQDEVKDQNGVRKEGHRGKDAENNEEENYEEEEDAVEDTLGQDKGTRRRAEM